MQWHYRCPTCGRIYAIEPGRYLCDVCAAAQKSEEPLRGVLECTWEGTDPEPGTIPLPVEPEYFPSIPVGKNTALGSGASAPGTWYAKSLAQRRHLQPFRLV